MRKWQGLLLLITAVVLVAVLAACGGGGSKAPEGKGAEKQGEQAPTQQPQPQAQLPKLLSLGTHPMGSLYNAQGTGIATVLSKTTPMEVKAVATSGPSEWLPMFVSKEMDLGIANAYDSEQGWQGLGPYEKISQGKGFPVRLVAVGAPNINSAIVSEESGIKTAQDLKGKRYVGNYTGSAGITAQAMAFLANHGLSEKDVKMMSVPGVSDGIRAIIEGRADANGSSVIGMGVVQELDAAKGARFLSLDNSPEAIKRLQEVFPPGYAIRVEPGPNKAGVKEPIYMMAYDTYLVARGDLAEEAVYAVVKSLWEDNQQLWPIHPQLKEWKPEGFASPRAMVPYHPGAIKYFKEKGAWNQQMEDLQQRLLAREKK